MTNEQRAELLWHGLNDCRNSDPDTAIATVTHWLEYHGAGYPDVQLMIERVRDDARFWAASASQAELEAYLSAAIMELDLSPLTERAAKRLTALGFKNMTAGDREKFKRWVDSQ